MTRGAWTLTAAVALVALALLWLISQKATVSPVQPSAAPASPIAAQSLSPVAQPAPAPTAAAQTPVTSAQPAPAPTAAAETPVASAQPTPAPTAAAETPAASAQPATAPTAAAQTPVPSAQPTPVPTAAAQTPAASAQPAPAPTAAAQTPVSSAEPAPTRVATTKTTRPLSTPDAGEKSADTVSRANEKSKGELTSLKSDFRANDLVAALNDSIANFAHGSSELPTAMVPLLQNAADDMKQLPAGYVMEIGGYTDSTGDAQGNVALSQRRANAVRDALVKAGANADMLIAKGYGSANPIASNDTPEGRERNRRIEYHVLRTP